MISVLLNWSYITILAFVIGFGMSNSIAKVFHYKIKKLSNYLLVWLVFFTVYAPCFSLVYKVGFLVNLLIVILVIFVGIVQRKSIKQYLVNWWLQKRKERFFLLEVILSILGIVTISFCTSRGYIHYDTSLYHAQSIRWIEEYGTVVGLGNLHNRFAYNSAAFPRTAFFSMSLLGPQSLHIV